MAARSEDQSPCFGHVSLAVLLGVEVGTVITVLTVDEALQHTCAIFREHADLGDITPAECDLLIDGAILLAMRIDGQDRVDPSRPGFLASRTATAPAGRHERQAAA